MAEKRTPGQAAYENDVRRQPTYHTGQKRPAWEELSYEAQQSWERNPTPRGSKSE